MKCFRFLIRTLLIGMILSTFVESSAPVDQKPSQLTLNPASTKPVDDGYVPDWCDPDDLSAGTETADSMRGA